MLLADFKDNKALKKYNSGLHKAVSSGLLENEQDFFCFQHEDKVKGEFSNFASQKITIDGITYPTSEHYFQHMGIAHNKTEFDKLTEKLELGMSTKGIYDHFNNPPKVVKDNNWNKDSIDVMFTAISAKLGQHPDNSLGLLMSGRRVMVETARYDAKWGTGEGGGKLQDAEGWKGKVSKDNPGHNLLGKLYMVKRDELLDLIVDNFKGNALNAAEKKAKKEELAEKFGEMNRFSEVNNEIEKLTGYNIADLMKRDQEHFPSKEKARSPDTIIDLPAIKGLEGTKKVFRSVGSTTGHHQYNHCDTTNGINKTHQSQSQPGIGIEAIQVVADKDGSGKKVFKLDFNSPEEANAFCQKYNNAEEVTRNNFMKKGDGSVYVQKENMQEILELNGAGRYKDEEGKEWDTANSMIRTDSQHARSCQHAVHAIQNKQISGHDVTKHQSQSQPGTGIKTIQVIDDKNISGEKVFKLDFNNPEEANAFCQKYNNAEKVTKDNFIIKADGFVYVPKKDMQEILNSHGKGIYKDREGKEWPLANSMIRTDSKHARSCQHAVLAIQSSHARDAESRDKKADNSLDEAFNNAVSECRDIGASLSGVSIKSVAGDATKSPGQLPKSPPEVTHDGHSK